MSNSTKILIPDSEAYWELHSDLSGWDLLKPFEISWVKKGWGTESGYADIHQFTLTK